MTEENMKEILSKPRLAPCPFCGESSMDVFRFEDVEGEDVFVEPFTIFCSNRKCATSMSGTTLEEAVRRWNRRDFTKLEWLGRVGVDGGTFIVVDPAAMWDHLHDYLIAGERELESYIATPSFEMERWAEEHGVLARWGDGAYPAYVAKDANGNTAALIIYDTRRLSDD